MSMEYIELLNKNLSKAIQEGKLQLETGQDEQRLMDATKKLNDKTRSSFIRSCIATAVLDYLYIRNIKAVQTYRLPILVLAPFFLSSILSKKEYEEYEAQKLIVVYKYEKQLLNLYPELMSKRTQYSKLPPTAQPALHQLQADGKDSRTAQFSNSTRVSAFQGSQTAASYQPISSTTSNSETSSYYTLMPNQTPDFNKSAPNSNVEYSGVSWDPYGFYKQNNLYKRFS